MTNASRLHPTRHPVDDIQNSGGDDGLNDDIGTKRQTQYVWFWLIIYCLLPKWLITISHADQVDFFIEVFESLDQSDGIPRQPACQGIPKIFGGGTIRGVAQYAHMD